MKIRNKEGRRGGFELGHQQSCKALLCNYAKLYFHAKHLGKSPF